MSTETVWVAPAAWEVTNEEMRYWTVCREKRTADGIEADHRRAGYPQTIVRPLWRTGTIPAPTPPATLAASPARADAEPEWPKLDKPATVGGGTFGKGVTSRFVVEAAQRLYEREGEQRAMTPAQRDEQEASRRALWDMIHGSPIPEQGKQEGGR